MLHGTAFEEGKYELYCTSRSFPGKFLLSQTRICDVGLWGKRLVNEKGTAWV